MYALTDCCGMDFQKKNYQKHSVLTLMNFQACSVIKVQKPRIAAMRVSNK